MNLRMQLRRRNYFLLPPDTYLIVKVSRISQPFYGLGDQFVRIFDQLTKQSGTFFFVGLDSATTGWLVSKNHLLHEINTGSISCSDGVNKEYKIHAHDLGDRRRFLSVDDFLNKASTVQRN